MSYARALRRRAEREGRAVVPNVRPTVFARLEDAPAGSLANGQSICLSSIFREDDSRVVEQCLRSVRPLLSAWRIVDTGSSDEVKATIRRVLADIPGELIERDWRDDFAWARNVALDAARESGCDFALFMDADDFVEPAGYMSRNGQSALPELPKMLPGEDDVLTFPNSCNITQTYRPTIARLSIPWRWRGLVHESLRRPDDADTVMTVFPGFVLRETRAGRASRDETAKRRHYYELLRKSVAIDPTDTSAWLNLVSHHYTNWEWEALGECARRCLALILPSSAAAYSCRLLLALSEAMLGASVDDVIASFLRLRDECPERAEAPRYLAEYLHRRGERLDLARELDAFADTLPIPATAYLADRRSYRQGPRSVRVAIVVPRPPGYVHAAALLDLAEPLCEGLRANRYNAAIVDVPGDADRAIVVGPHLLTGAPPAGAILYNTEQVSPDSPWLTGPLLDLYRRHRVWDYDPRNTEALRRAGVDAVTVPPGYAPGMPRIRRDVEQDIDVLFFGCVNPRRAKVLNELIDRGVKVAHSSDLYGAERDEAIARAKIVLNVHHYAAKIFEAARVSYLLANRCFVVTEEAEHMPWSGAYVAVPYDRLVETCITYLAKHDERKRIAELGFDTFSRCTAADMVRPVANELASGPLLSVLVPTIPGRMTSSAAALIENLERQAEGKPVEVLCLYDNFQRTEGSKRNEMLSLAKGLFSVFVDDDDRIAPDYVDALLAAIEENPKAKVIVFDVQHCPGGQPGRRVAYGVEHDHGQTPELFTRKPNHLMCWHTALARSVPFPDLGYGEDTVWAERIASRVSLADQARIDRVLYWYDDRGASVERMRNAAGAQRATVGT